MTSLNSKLQLAMLNRKKGRNLLEKGFTLVELMIVIVIVGILSAVALPQFISQTSKAKATECTTKAGSMLGLVASEALLSPADGDTLLASQTGAAVSNGTNPNSVSEYCTFSTGSTRGTGTVYEMTVLGKTGTDLAGKYAGKFCVDYVTGKKDFATSETGTTAGVAALTVSC